MTWVTLHLTWSASYREISWYSAFLAQYVRVSMFLILPYTMGHANGMSILIGLMCLSPKMSQPWYPYLTMHAWYTKEVLLWCGFGHLPWHSANSPASASTSCDQRFKYSNFLSLVTSLASARIAWGSCGLWFPVCKTFTIYPNVKIHLGHGEIIQIIGPVFQSNSLCHCTGLRRLCKIRKNLCHMRKSC